MAEIENDANSEYSTDIENAFTSLADDLIASDKALDYTSSKRQVLAEKLFDIVDRTKIDPNNTKSEQLFAQLNVFSTASSILNDIDKQAISRAKLKLTAKDVDSQEKDREEIIATLKQINLSTFNSPYEEQNDEELDHTLEGELGEDLEIKEGELKTDHNDFDTKEYDGMDVD